ncbi:MAG TPA: ATP-binding protein [Candidatus Udaeobacter sp.]|nr:ATP-binding protein [Candidatus Udaeobacter sp.]
MEPDKQRGEVHAAEREIIITTTNDSQGQSRVEIVDTGLGIEPETLPKIFDAFEQGGRTQLGAWA